METLPCLQEVELICLSGDIPHTSYSKLCNALGYSYDWCQTTLANHRGNYIEAMTEILIKWHTERAEKSQLRRILGNTLHFVNLGGLGKKLSQGEFLPRHNEPHEQQATPLQSSSGENVPSQQQPHGQKATPLQSIPDEYIPNQQEPHGQEATPLQSTPGEFPPRNKEPHKQQATPLQSSSDINNEKISESLTVQKCREKLENKYLNQLCKIQMKPWDHTDYAEFEDMHTVVTMVKKDAHGKDTNKKEILKGSVADIFSTKVNGRLPDRILISAPAGRGKTTAVAKMAYDWVHRERGSALEHLPLLFVVKFRNTSQLTSIGEAIKSQLLSDVDDLTPKGIESFIRKNQGICHIILDGLDEYAGISSSQSSSLSNIVSVICWEEFPQCRVLVTTRPHLENFFDQDDLARVYTKMWIEGFSRESSREYIDKFFDSNRDSGCGLKVYLDDQPLINELVKTPLFCLMICHLWSEGQLDRVITTQTELLDRVNVFLMHHANTRSKHRVKITPKKLRKIISQLGEVALAGLLDDANKLVFTPHDFRKVPAILDRACELGIVSKTTVYIACLPQSKETTSTTIEFYHKLAQEHSAGKFLADQTYHFLLRLKISKLDRVLRKIKANIGDYENLIRFAAGTDNNLCVRIMEVLLANNILDESERYRILLDCSSETKGTEGNVSSLVQRCVTAQSIVLKSPTVYTVVGMQNLPKVLKHKVGTIKFEGSTLTTNVTSGLWSCLEAFSMLHTLTISDSSLSFPSSPPKLLSVTKLSADKVTSQSYEGVLSSIPGVRDIDVSIDVAETITTASRPMSMSQTKARDEHFFVHIRLHASPALTTDIKIISGNTIGGLSLLIEDQTDDQQRLHVSGVKGRDEEALVDLFVKTKQLTYLHSESGGASLNKKNAFQNTRLEIEQCQLSSEMTETLWSSLRSYTPLNHLTISGSSLSFPPSPPELPSVTKLSAVRVTAQSYEDLFSSLPGLKEVDITIGDANPEEISQIRTSLRRHLTGKDLTHINPHSVTSEGNVSILSRKRMRGLGFLITECQAILSGVFFGPKETVIDLVQSSTRLMSARLYVEQLCRSLNSDQDALHKTRFEIEQCQLSTEMTEKLWSSLRSFTSLNHLTISDSYLRFPPSPPELPSVTKLSVKRVTSQSYEGLLSSLRGLKEVDITIGDANTGDIFQIQTSLRRHLTGQYLTCIDPHSFPSDGNVSSMPQQIIRGLGFLITECQAILSGVVFGPEETVIDLVQSSTRLMSASQYEEQFFWSLNSNQDALHIDTLKIKDCQLSNGMTDRLWSCLRSCTSLTQLSISDSSLSFHPSHPELLSVTKLSAERVTSLSFEGVLSSVPGVRDIDVSIGVAETSNTASTSIPMGQTRATYEQFLVHIRLQAWPALTTDMKIDSGESIRGVISLLFPDQTKDQQRLHVSGMRGRDEEALVDLFVKTKQLTSLNSGSGGGSLSDTDAIQNTRLKIQQCQLSTEMTEKLWSYLRSFTSLNHLTISDSSLSFPPSPPDLPSVTKLSVERVTSQSYEGLLSSLRGLEEVDITIGDANTEDISQIQTSLRRHLTGQYITCINPHSFLSDGNVSSIVIERMRGLGFLTTECEAILCGVVFGPVETVIDLFQSSTRLMSASLYVEQFFWSLNSNQDAFHIIMWNIKDCQLSAEMTIKLWSCLGAFITLNHLTISDSSLSFPPSPPELSSVTKLSAERVTSQSYEGLLASLPGLRDIDITIDDAERDIPQITAGLRRTKGQQLTTIRLKAQSSLPSEMNSVSRETVRGLGLLIREQTKNLRCFYLTGVKCLDEEDLVDLIEFCRRVETLSDVWFYLCGTRKGGRLESHLKGHHTSPRGDLNVYVYHDGNVKNDKSYIISHIY